MPKIYHECDKGVTDMAAKLIDRHYREFIDAGLTICWLFVENPDAIGSALTHGGYPAAATVKANSLKDRVEGKADVTITIDKQWWDGHDELQCTALLDHELFHVMLAHDDDGKVITDDAGRPKTKMKLHDFQIGGFLEIAKRHLLNAEEVAAIQSVQGSFVQMKLDFGGAWG